MMSHDAFTTAVAAIRGGGSGTNMWYSLHGASKVDGVTGDIALDDDGNTINKPIPVLRLQPDGSMSFVELGRPG